MTEGTGGTTPDAAGAILVDLWSDIVCPWCTIGRHRIERALAMRPDLEVDVRWRAFQLHPDWPARGLSWQDFTTARRGSPQAAVPVFDRVERVAAADGLHFDFSRVRRVPHTADAHRLILRAQRAVSPWAVVAALADGYFSGRADLTDREQLADLVSVVGGGGRDEVLAFLAGDELSAEVGADLSEARALGISGVPFVVLDGRLAVSGAQSVETFLAALDRVAAG